MNLLVLHGPAINSSREKLTRIKQQFDTDNISVFEKGANFQDVLANLQTESLFGGMRLVVLENPSKDFVLDSALSTMNSLVTLLLWFDSEIDTENYHGSEISFFPEEKEASIFPLLNSLGSRDNKAFFELEKRNRTSPNDTQYILTMVFYLLRSLVVTPKAAKDFVKIKNEKMRANFEKEDLVNLYRKTLEIDFKIKSGLMETAQADFSVVNNFLKN